jgi:hypothetical protein
MKCIVSLGGRICWRLKAYLGMKMVVANRAQIPDKNIVQLFMLKSFFIQEGEDERKDKAATRISPSNLVTIFKLFALFLDFE